MLMLSRPSVVVVRVNYGQPVRWHQRHRERED
jgi:hypothetical protein